MKWHLNSKIIAILLFTQFLFSCKNNISAGVGSDGKRLDSTAGYLDTAAVSKKNIKQVKE